MGVYKEIATIYLHHAYFLDLGEAAFETIDPKDQKNQIIENAVSSAMFLRPTLGTAIKLKNHQYRIVPINNGLSILAYTKNIEVQGQEKYTPLISMKEDLKLNFEFGYKDKDFRTYTSINSLTETPLYFMDNESLDTNKAIDNNSLLSEVGTRSLMLSLAKEEDYETNKTGLYAQVKKMEEMREATNDNQAKETINNQINALIDRFILSKKRHGLIGQIQLSIKGSNKDLLEIDHSNPQAPKYYAKVNAPILTIGLANKKIHWRYIDLSNDLTYTTPTVKPFTKNGHIPIKESDFDAMVDPDRKFPNASIHAPQKKDNNLIYTEIYI